MHISLAAAWVTSLYLLCGEQCVDVLHSIEVCSVQRVLAGENLGHRRQTTVGHKVMADGATLHI